MQEHSDKPMREIAYAFSGDAKNNMGDSLLFGGQDGHGCAALRAQGLLA
jgi:ornithine carbamoyltransferase